MNKSFIENNNIIERYLLGELSEEEAVQFNLALMQDENLQKEVKTNRLLFKMLWKANQAMKTPPKNGQSWWRKSIWLLLIPIVFGLFFLIKNASETPAPIPSETPATEASPIENNLPSTENENSIKEEILSEEKTQNTDNQKNTKEQQKKKASKKPVEKLDKEPPIIAANFEVNPILENYLSSKRSNGFSIKSPNQIENFELKNGVLNFEIKGTYQPENGKIEEEILIYFFTNKKEDFEQFRPIISEALKFEKAENEGFDFEWNQDLTLESGLYYYQIEGENSGLFYVGKFVVK